jgi:hypothetical protein
MAKTLADLFKSRIDEVYNNLGSRTLIETHGLVNIPRKAALLVSSPTAIGALIGDNVGSTLKGSANRPTDTIYNNKTFLSKPVSLFPGAITGVEDAIQSGQSYYIKKSPGNPNVVSTIKQGASNPKHELMKAGVQLLKSPTSTLKKFNDLTGKLKKRFTSDSYGPEKSEDGEGKIRKDTIKYTTHAPIYQKKSTSREWVQVGVEERKTTKTIDDIISNILKRGNEYLTDLQTDNKQINGPYVLIESYPDKKNKILLPGTIFGLSEDASPEWNGFKFVGSPFQMYRYSGVERNIKFEIKLYYTDYEEKKQMKKTLNKLRKLVFPNENVAAATYAGNTSALAFTPNILYLTIYGIYNQILCVMDTFSLTIDDTSPWVAGYNKQIEDAEGSKMSIDDYNEEDKPFPVSVQVSLGFKIIETPQILESNGKHTYEYAIEEDEKGLPKSYFTDPDNAIKSENDKDKKIKQLEEKRKQDAELAAKLNKIGLDAVKNIQMASFRKTI